MSKIYIDLFLNGRTLKKKIQSLRQLWVAAQQKSHVADIKLTLRIDGKDYIDQELNEYLSKNLPVASILTALMSKIDADIALYKAEAQKFFQDEINTP